MSETIVVAIIAAVIGALGAVIAAGFAEVVKHWLKEKKPDFKRIKIIIPVFVVSITVGAVVGPTINDHFTTVDTGSFNLEADEERRFSFFLEAKGFRGGENISFAASNGDCDRSSSYVVYFIWGKFVSEEILMECGKGQNAEKEFFTGFGGGNVELEAIFKIYNEKAKRPVTNASLRISYGTKGHKLKWIEQ
ncbi:hypothetical protein [Candidatus Thiosymbion oneisti]|uniref:hypothetical protein n=1 Tax=Candidatus Thiosymbion oneisti TaxID=589554 RepID=UPI000B7E9D73|nr:hypothetical protein [Candidatus Thiosymbion oneisti]